MSNLIRKIVIKEAIFLNCYGNPKEFECDIIVPDNISGDEEDEILQNTINKIRKILNIDKIDEV